ncbi:hypothetical protein ACJ73_04129 [Blastomyces percursus]|uniref:Uncharacterized protein n=1 Tax=Blastomyces percursus TaxID=1658174 RepID=A0A1J9R952_9EURO|nr:hypothetical protein ACJ73_04129 [Blastomyces percursus]
MDVTRQSFSQRLLNCLAESSFVALDLEFSGIVPKRSAPSPGGNLWGEQQTLQTRYEEVKEAADTYQVLQIGLTFAMEDKETATYVLRPYNLHLNPVLDEKLGVERRWSYQSCAIEFLIKNGFRMEAPFVEGLSYLSRLEEQLAMTKLAERENRTAKLADIKPENMDPESRAFVAEVRGLVDSWIDEIGLVRAEYLSLVSISRNTFVQIIPYNKQREEYIRIDKCRALRERIVQQMGFRWIVEGMVGGDLSAMDPSVFLPCVTDSATVDTNALSNYFDDSRSKLKSRQPVLVGHNLFTDLINFYKCFIGNLPDRIEDFKEAIQTHYFPL